MDGFHLLGWLAAALTIFTYSQKNMLRLRISAISASTCFIIWSIDLGVYPTLALHAILLPLNIHRLIEIRRNVQRVSAAQKQTSSLDGLRPWGKPIRFQDGMHIFRKDVLLDPLDYPVSGEVEFDEHSRTAEPGELFGDVAFLTAQRERVPFVRCQDYRERLAVNAADQATLTPQYPAFNFYVMRVIAAHPSADPMSSAPANDVPFHGSDICAQGKPNGFLLAFSRTAPHWEYQ